MLFLNAPLRPALRVAGLLRRGVSVAPARMSLTAELAPPEILIFVFLGWPIFRQCLAQKAETLESLSTYWNVLISGSGLGYLVCGYAATLNYLQFLSSASVACMLLFIVLLNERMHQQNRDQRE